MASRAVKRSVSVGIALIVAALIALAGVVRHFSDFVILGDDTDHPTTAQIEGRGRFRLPPSARDVTAHLEGFQDHIIWVCFRMKPSDEARFWSSSMCSAVPSTETAPHEFEPLARPWWNPEKATLSSYRTFSTPTGDTQRILIDKDDPADFIVYVEAFDI